MQKKTCADTYSIWDIEKIRSAPLDVEVVEEQKAGRVVVRTLYFTSDANETRTYRVFGYYAFPKDAGKKLPAILFVHGGGGTADRNTVIQKASQGYACFSLDWTGKAPGRDKYTDWAKQSLNLHDIKKSPEKNFIYDAAVAVMRSVTFLCSQDEVDASRIGLEGWSWGSYLILLVNGIDPRIRTCVAGYGCGGFKFEDSNCSRGVNSQSLARRQMWYDFYDPLAYAGRSFGSVLMINPTNDAFFWLNTAVMNFNAVNTRKTQIFAANLDHEMDPRTASCVGKWFDRELRGIDLEFPQTPAVKLEAKNKKLILRVAEGSDLRQPQTEGVEAYCTYGDPGRWSGRYWYFVAMKKEKDSWAGELPVLDIYDTISYICTLSALNGTRSSFGTGDVVPSGKGIKKPTAQYKPFSEDFEEGAKDWLVGNYLFADERLAVMEDDKQGKFLEIQVLNAQGKPKQYAVRTHKFDGYLLGKFGYTGLSFKVNHSTITGKFQVLLYENESRKNQRIKAVTITKKEGVEWEEVKVPFSDFKGLKLGQVDALWITGASGSSLSPSFDDFAVYK